MAKIQAEKTTQNEEKKKRPKNSFDNSNLFDAPFPMYPDEMLMMPGTVDNQLVNSYLQSSIDKKPPTKQNATQPKAELDLDGFRLPEDPGVITVEYWNSLTEEQQKDLHYNRNKYQENTVIPESIDLNNINKDEWDNKEEAIAHNLGEGVSGNIDLRGVGKREHQQAIYDRNGNLVTTPEDMGTYDFVVPGLQLSSDPLAGFRGHFVTDVNPWIKWGNSPNDTTTCEQRIEALKSSVVGWIGYQLWGNSCP